MESLVLLHMTHESGLPKDGASADREVNRFELLGNREMAVRVECCIWGRDMQGRGTGSRVASELYGREEIEAAGWDST